MCRVGLQIEFLDGNFVVGERLEVLDRNTSLLDVGGVEVVELVSKGVVDEGAQDNALRAVAERGKRLELGVAIAVGQERLLDVFPTGFYLGLLCRLSGCGHLSFPQWWQTDIVGLERLQSSDRSMAFRHGAIVSVPAVVWVVMGLSSTARIGEQIATKILLFIGGLAAIGGLLGDIQSFTVPRRRGYPPLILQEGFSRGSVSSHILSTQRTSVVRFVGRRYSKTQRLKPLRPVTIAPSRTSLTYTRNTEVATRTAVSSSRSRRRRQHRTRARSRR